VNMMWRTIATLLAIAALTVGAAAAFADDGGGRSGGGSSGSGHGGPPQAEDHQGKHDDAGAKDDKGKHDDAGAKDNKGENPGKRARSKVETYTLSGSHGNPEGIAYDNDGHFFVSATGDGSIWRGELHDTATPVPTFIAGAAGNSATGLKIFKGKLYVSGASTGTIKIYDVDSGALLAVFDTKGANAGPTFVNDLVVMRNGDVFATDSFRPAIYHLTAAEIAAGTPTPKPIDSGDVITTTPEIPFDAGPNVFNLNGIVRSKSGGSRSVTVVDTNTGRFFTVGTRDSNAERTIDEVDVDGGPIHGDGLLVDRGRLLAVEGGTDAFPNGVVNFIKLRRGGTEGRVDDQRSDPSLAGPSTIARARNQYLIVNANFAGGSAGPFTVTGLPRNGS
jgi:sugar lactone lactonase YvrE